MLSNEFVRPTSCPVCVVITLSEVARSAAAAFVRIDVVVPVTTAARAATSAALAVSDSVAPVNGPFIIAFSKDRR